MRDNRRLIEVILITFVMVLIPTIASSHIIKEAENTFLSGLRHPVYGFDHLLAMVSVGLLSAQLGGRAIWTVPATFVSFMVIGGIIGMTISLTVTLVEYGIAVSVLTLGSALALARKLSTPFAMAFVGMFGVFHGYVHGVEMPIVARIVSDPALYALGFTTSTAGLHIIGVVTGYFATRNQYGARLLRITGAVIAMSGVYFILQV